MTKLLGKSFGQRAHVGKPRTIYCHHALRALQSKLALTNMSGNRDTEQLKLPKEEEQLVMGSHLFPAGRPLCNLMFAIRALSCSVPAK